ncbi:MAG TPA: universal stress protein [Kiritimatiellia bacterium]|nr:universal stress protein [Kiritimatiellia bacterium]HMO98539.1 universal stress protein [Kiritimatiellia bacterium]HMP96975.1 universal stress protein [Kiritimatiellia bacterium]
MFNRALIATDLSAASDRVVRSASALKAWGTTEVVLLRCLQLPDLPVVDSGVGGDFLVRQLDEQKKLLEAAGFTVQADVRTGSPKLEIMRAAHDHRASLVVVGSHGASMAKELLLGGVAAAVIHACTKPVLIVRTGEDMRETGADVLRHVLFPTDFSAPAEHAERYLMRLIQAGVRRVTLLHVQDPRHIDPHRVHRLDEFNAIDANRLENVKQRVSHGPAETITTCIRYGNPLEEITRFARENEVSLVVMSSQGKGFIKELFLGSVSHHVVRHADVPVLLIPPPREHDEGEAS